MALREVQLTGMAQNDETKLYFNYSQTDRTAIPIKVGIN